jgi:nicotinate-nucleotide pyrophosphorylase (carboxylating)
MGREETRPRSGRGRYHQLEWDACLAAHVSRQAALWFAEDVGCEGDWTSIAVVPAASRSCLDIVVRQAGVVCGLAAAEQVVAVADPGLVWQPVIPDGAVVGPGAVIATLTGFTRAVLGAERVLLNFLGRLSGIATATRRLVDTVEGLPCEIYDTRKTVPGWRLLDKLAVRAGGGCNHRLGLYDGILIKDNHLAALDAGGMGPAAAVLAARDFLARTFAHQRAASMVVEVEVDSVSQAEQVLAVRPDVVLLDNMAADDLGRCVAIRDALAPEVVLEASGGIRPDTVRQIAATGVDRISTGWPTHAAPWLDIALDWPREQRSAGP